MSAAQDPPQVSDEPAASSAQPTRQDKRARRREVRKARRDVVGHLTLRLVATLGIVGIGVAIAAIMVSSGSSGWTVGLVVAIVSVLMTAGLWARQL
jgi:hypothetical protein